VAGVDADTGEVGVAVASCVPFEVVVVPVIAPEQGAGTSQAAINRNSGPPMLAALQSGADAEAVIAAVTDSTFDPQVAERQFGVVTLAGSADGFTGADTMAVALNEANATQTATAQGNILVSEQVVADSLAAFDTTSGSLAEKLMAALAAGSAAGGDSRCGARTASSAALIVAKPGDPAWEATGANKSDPTADQRPSTYLSVIPSGNQNAVELLEEVFASTPEVDGQVYARDVPWLLDTFGVPPMFALVAGGFLLLLAGVFGALIWWLVRRSRKKKSGVT